MLPFERQTDLSMIIQQHAWTVGSSSGADPNAHSFQSGDHRHPKKKSQDLDSTAGATLTTQPGYHGQSDLIQEQLGEAISLGQTQNAFLGKVHDSLDQMKVLSDRAADHRAHSEPESDQQEFASLQASIDNCRAKMMEAAQVFHAAWPDASVEPPASLIEPRQLSSLVGFRQKLERLHDPNLTTSDNGATATNTSEIIQGAIRATEELRAAVAENLQQLEKARLELCASDDKDGLANRITDQGFAVESTQLARFNMLAKSSAAMLAQANAVPQSTLRLLA